MSPLEFLQAELEHAGRHLARIRRIQAQKQAALEAQGLDEVAVYDHLAIHKAHRQLQRDEAFYQQMWLRLHRHLARLQPAAATENVVPFDKAVAGLPAVAAAAAKPQPLRNQPCPCGSTLKYKRCCGNPLRQAA